MELRRLVKLFLWLDCSDDDWFIRFFLTRRLIDSTILLIGLSGSGAVGVSDGYASISLCSSFVAVWIDNRTQYLEGTTWI